MSEQDCLFCAILHGNEPAKVVYKDKAARLALIESLYPEGAIHWLAIPFEHVPSVEALAQDNAPRFQDLMEFALNATKKLAANYPDLRNGFTIKMHIGPFETVSHAKLHILSVE